MKSRMLIMCHKRRRKKGRKMKRNTLRSPTIRICKKRRNLMTRTLIWKNTRSGEPIIDILIIILFIIFSGILLIC